MSETRVVQQVKGGKWHHVWWMSPIYERLAGTFLTHVGPYRPEQHPVVGKGDVAQGDLCRQCFKSRATPTDASEPPQADTSESEAVR